MKHPRLNILLFLILTVFLLSFSVFISTKEFKERTDQGCGEQIEVIERVHWVWQWWPNRDGNKGFIACIGPSYFITYRPFDVAAVGFMLSIGLVIVIRKCSKI